MDSAEDRAQIAHFVRDIRGPRHFSSVMETQIGRNEFASFCQLIQELINGSVRRHTFSEIELELLFHLQSSRIRKSSRTDSLRRYLRAVHQHYARESSLLKLAAFLDRENTYRFPSSPATSAGRQVACLPQAG